METYLNKFPKMGYQPPNTTKMSTFPISTYFATIFLQFFSTERSSGFLKFLVYLRDYVFVICLKIFPLRIDHGKISKLSSISRVSVNKPICIGCGCSVQDMQCPN
jgi:hypothetical protein